MTALTDLVKIGARTTSNFFEVLLKSYKEAACANAPSGGVLQRFLGATLGLKAQNPLSVQEAFSILGLSQKETSEEKILQRAKELFKINNPRNGGSPYLQSKILTAQQVLMKNKHENENENEKEKEKEKEK
ncbi:import inner membrane translocase subunit tim16 [Anaeramoeba ignava]|uniref:Import inner membrane translocase subunit tim16 n=1 Tax=Anaeramoeba ignava TaxID=1746090 RepID=A0A9Q0LD78_ANAIG|nr:import inner membrane translocase subunit tim16 [Anaeramoeba ignava]